MQTPRNTLSAALFIGVMATSSALSLYAGGFTVLPELPSFGFEEAVKGKATHAFEDKFAEAAPAYEISRTFWGVTDYALFHEGRDGVVVGKDGWLFSSEEFSWPKNAGETVLKNMTYVQEVNDLLKDKNIPLLVALVPSKTRIETGNLDGNIVPAYRQELYNDIITKFAAKGIMTVDLRDVMGRTEGSFLRTDTHWTPEGARQVASEIANAVKAMAAPRGVPVGTNTFVSRKEGDTTDHSGDLLRYIPLGAYADIGPMPDKLAAYKTETVQGGDGDDAGDLFGEASMPYTLVGTSYSADTRWNFAGFLKESIGEDILNVADPGQGPFVTMKAYLESKAFTDTPPQFIIWEMPERYFPISKPVTEKPEEK